MLNELKKHSNITRTTNGDYAYKSTLDAVLDLFARGGSLRHDMNLFVTLLDKAYATDKELTLKTLFYLRDIRSGQGERDVFRVGIKHLANKDAESVSKVVPFIKEYGRWDDLITLLDTPLRSTVVDIIKQQLSDDIWSLAQGQSVSLLAKWLPSANASSAKTRKAGRLLAKELGFTEKQYRKVYGPLRKKINLVETLLSEKRNDKIDYSKLPSKAHKKYIDAFYRHDDKRYSAYIDSVSKGESKINASTLYPYDLVHEILSKTADSWGDIVRPDGLSEEEKKTLDVMWKNLPDYSEGMTDNSLVVVDTSGSMYGHTPNAPINVAVSLGIYLAEHNKGVFHNHFVTFHDSPELVEISGTDLTEKVWNMAQAEWGGTTNLEATFDLILDTAKSHNLSKEEVVKRLVIISDMQFNHISSGSSDSVLTKAQKDFEEAGYDFPEIIFWNVEGSGALPITKDDKRVSILSGSSLTIMKQLLSGKDLDPIQFMLEVLLSARYEAISII